MNTAKVQSLVVAIASIAALFAGSSMAAGAPTNAIQDGSMMPGVVAGSATTAPAASRAEDAQSYVPPTAAQLIQLLAPVAVFPDTLVAQVLAASSYPDQVSEANAWLARNGTLKGPALQQALDQQSWDPGVKAIVMFPDVLHQMAGNIEWTTSLGDAYVNDPTDVMNAVQSLRQRAVASGNLKSNKYLNVTSQPKDANPAPVSRDIDEDDPPEYSGPPIVPPPEQVVEIAPADPENVYVPYYDPGVFYGAPIALWPGYAYAWPAPVYYGVGFGAFAFGAAVAIDIGFGRPWGWGAWGAHWGPGYYGHGWRGPTVVHNNRPYFDHSSRIVNHFATRAGVNGHPAAGFNRPGLAGNRTTPAAGRAGFANGESRVGAAQSPRSAAFGASRAASTNFNRMSMPRFTGDMAARGNGSAQRNGIGSRASGVPGGLASAHYAPHEQAAMANRAGAAARSSEPSLRGGYSGAQRQYSPSYGRTQMAPSNRSMPMQAQRYAAPRSFQGGGAYARNYGARNYSAPRAVSRPSSPGRGGESRGGRH